MMTEKFKILSKFIKDMSSETKDVVTYMYVKDNISKYELDINIKSIPLKNKIVEVNDKPIMSLYDDTTKVSYLVA